MIEYKQHSNLPNKYIKTKISEFLKEDMPNGDITTKNIALNSDIIKAKIYALEKLVFAGAKILPYFFNSECTIQSFKVDGDIVYPHEKIGEIDGPAKILLSRERVMLNLIQRLCGIASETQKYVQLVNNHNIKILDTRKTTPGIRLFEKYAVIVGGGYNHRLNLSEGILIKDNHILSSGSITRAIKEIIKTNLGLPIEIEVDTLDQVEKALKFSIDGFLLDNMSPEITKKAVKMIRLSRNGSKIFIEASGGITKNNLASYLHTGINAISVGALTHGAISKNIKLEFN